VVTRGEVWWYEHPEHARRPFAILTRDAAIAVLEQILAVPATRTVRGIPTEVELDESDGMPTRCVLAVDNLTVVRKSLCTERITKLDDGRMLAVCEALRVATAC
jgi:mRNA interferase MazF